MYQQIDSNRRRSVLLIAVFIGVLAAVGYVYGLLTDTGYAGLIFALIVSVFMSLGSWFGGDKLILWTSGAQEIKTREQLPYVWNMVENLAITAGIPRPRIYLIQDEAMNAFATGRDPQHASIAVTSAIVQGLENEELEGVIAHELSHIKNADVRIMMLAAVLVGAITLLGDFFVRGLWGRRGNNREKSELGAIGLVVGIIFILLSPLIGQLIQLAISRRREYLADASGALLTRYPEGLARALEKIAQANTPVERASSATAHLWIASPFKPGAARSFFTNLFSTHPPIEERIHALRKML